MNTENSGIHKKEALRIASSADNRGDKEPASKNRIAIIAFSILWLSAVLAPGIGMYLDAHNPPQDSHKIDDVLRLLKSNTEEKVILWKILYLQDEDVIEPELAREIAHHVVFYSRKHDRDPNLVLAIMRVESNFNPKAESTVGAQGLMQIMPLWKRTWKIEEDLFSVESSIKWGLKILSFYQETYQDLSLALTAYNRGPGSVDLAMSRGIDPNNGYEAKVLDLYKKLIQLESPPETPFK